MEMEMQMEDRLWWWWWVGRACERDVLEGFPMIGNKEILEVERVWVAGYLVGVCGCIKLCFPEFSERLRSHKVAFGEQASWFL